MTNVIEWHDLIRKECLNYEEAKSYLIDDDKIKIIDDTITGVVAYKLREGFEVVSCTEIEHEKLTKRNDGAAFFERQTVTKIKPVAVAS